MTALPAISPEHIAEVRRLFAEYAAELRVDLCFQRFDEELASLPGRYAPPAGRLLLTRMGGQAAGCVALRSLENGVCEMKRLFVRPAFRRLGLGRILATASIREARRIGYRVMRLDTLESLTAALVLYESLGFRRVAPYYDNPLSGVVYLELALEVS